MLKLANNGHDGFITWPFFTFFFSLVYVCYLPFYRNPSLHALFYDKAYTWLVGKLIGQYIDGESFINNLVIQIKTQLINFSEDALTVYLLFFITHEKQLCS